LGFKKDHALHKRALTKFIVIMGHELDHEKRIVSNKGDYHMRTPDKSDADSDPEAGFFIETSVFNKNYIKISERMENLFLDPETYNDRIKMDEVLQFSEKSRKGSSNRVIRLTCHSFHPSKDVQKK